MHQWHATITCGHVQHCVLTVNHNEHGQYGNQSNNAQVKIVTTASGCGVKVTVDGKSVGTAKISFGESAMHGADPCDGQFKLTWYELPAKRGYLVEAASVMEDDPAMGSFVLGMGHALVVDPH
jgi:hypothetical protein